MSVNKWIAVEIDLQAHDKFIDLIDRLEDLGDAVNADHVQVCLERLWGHVYKNDPSGSFDTTPRKLNRICKYQGDLLVWFGALVESGFLDVDDDDWESAGPQDAVTVEVHNWHERAGKHLRFAETNNEQSRIRVKVSREIKGKKETFQAVTERDENRCRLCGTAVQWDQLKRPNGGSLALIDRAGDLTPENTVVRCYACRRRPVTGTAAPFPVPTPPADPPPEDLLRNTLRNSSVTLRNSHATGSVTLRNGDPSVPDSPNVPDVPPVVNKLDVSAGNGGNASGYVTLRNVTHLQDKTTQHNTRPSPSAHAHASNENPDEEDIFLRKENGEPPRDDGGSLLDKANGISPGLRRTRESSQYLKIMGRNLTRVSKSWGRIDPAFTEDWIVDTLLRAESQAGPQTKEYLLERMDEAKHVIENRASFPLGHVKHMDNPRRFATTVLINAITGKD